MAKSEGRLLHLTFIVESPTEASPTDLLGLVEYVDSFSRHIVETEALALFDELNLPSDWRVTTLQEIRRLGRRVPAPGEITRIQRGSWEIETALQGVVVLWFLRKYLHPVLQDAWNDSRLCEIIVEILRNRIFMGAKRSLEQKAVHSPRYRTLEISSIDEPETHTREELGICVTLERREVVEAKFRDQELRDDFLCRIQSERE